MAVTSIEDFSVAVEALIVEAKAAGLTTDEISAELEGILDGMANDEESVEDEE